MEYRKLGTSGLKVSAISLGAWLTYGSSHVEEQQAIACIRHAIEQGVNFIDVADMYSLGRGENDCRGRRSRSTTAVIWSSAPKPIGR